MEMDKRAEEKKRKDAIMLTKLAIPPKYQMTLALIIAMTTTATTQTRQVKTLDPTHHNGLKLVCDVCKILLDYKTVHWNPKMESELTNSFLNSSHHNALSFDFLVNEHFANDVSFHRYSPFDNGYVTSFLLSILSLMIGEHPSKHIHSSQRQIEGILVGILDGNKGMKTLTIVNDPTAVKGTKTMLIRNFFFEYKVSEIVNRNLSMKEREKIVKIFNGDVFVEEIVEYLVYDINADNRDLYKCGNKFVRPYIERIRNELGSVKNEEAHQVEKFEWLDANLHVVDKLLTNNRDDVKEWIQDLIRQLKSTSPTLKLYFSPDPVVHGSLHGIVFSAAIAFKFNVKIEAFLTITHNMHIKIEPHIFMTHTMEFWRPIYIRLGGQYNSNNKPSPNLLEKLSNIFRTYFSDDLRLTAVSELILDEIDTLHTYDMTPKTVSYIRFYLIGLLNSVVPNSMDVVYSNPANQKSPLVIEFADATFPLIVFNFYGNRTIAVPDLLLGQFEHKANTALVISIRGYPTACSTKLFHKDITYETKVDVVKNFSSPHKIEYYSRLDNSLLAFHVSKIHFRKDIDTNVAEMCNEIRNILLDSFNPVAVHEGRSTFEFYLQGLFFHMSHSEPEIQIDHFHSHIGYSVRLQSEKNVTQINFVKLRFSRQYFDYLSNNDEGYQILSILYEYNPILSYIKLRVHFSNDRMNKNFKSICLGFENMWQECSINNDDYGELKKPFYEQIAYNSFLGTELTSLYDKYWNPIYKKIYTDYRPMIEVQLMVKLDCQSPYVIHTVLGRDQNCWGTFLNFVEVTDHGPLCQYDALIDFQGCSLIDNNAQYGTFAYKLTGPLRGPVKMNLINKANIEHTIYMESIGISDIVAGLKMRKVHSNFSIEFTKDGYEISINMENEPTSSFDLTFARGAHIRYNKEFFIYIDTTRFVVGKFLPYYNELFQTVVKKNFALKAYPFYEDQSIKIENNNFLVNGRVNRVWITDARHLDVKYIDSTNSFVVITCQCTSNHKENYMWFRN
uniref:Uncharacterized protein n=1 Tax=Romanomermis culicivorax TaxID=13658 RepID=A0A915KCE2_ROMCU